MCSIRRKAKGTNKIYFSNINISRDRVLAKVLQHAPYWTRANSCPPMDSGIHQSSFHLGIPDQNEKARETKLPVTGENISKCKICIPDSRVVGRIEWAIRQLARGACGTSVQKRIWSILSITRETLFLSSPAQLAAVRNKYKVLLVSVKIERDVPMQSVGGNPKGTGAVVGSLSSRVKSLEKQTERYMGRKEGRTEGNVHLRSFLQRSERSPTY